VLEETRLIREDPKCKRHVPGAALILVARESLSIYLAHAVIALLPRTSIRVRTGGWRLFLNLNERSRRHSRPAPMSDMTRPAVAPAPEA
jgi:hypothetical protein